MQESATREKVLKKLRASLIAKTAEPTPGADYHQPIFHPADEVPEYSFANAFRQAGGQFHFCSDEIEFAEVLMELTQKRQWRRMVCAESAPLEFLRQCEFNVYSDLSQLPVCDVAISSCEYLIARTGSVVVSAASQSGRSLPFFSTAHVIVAFTNQLVVDLKDVLENLKSRKEDFNPSSLSFITGPGRTADIGNETVIGAQGPLETYVFLIDKDGW
ncbi:MAG: lactate utilization protein C [Bacteroidota bacterium]|jgi:L-lactate dehydrogenase complex protein LldG